MRNINLTSLDTDQIVKRKFDELADADRVVLVGGEKLEISIDSDKIANAVKEGLSNINFSTRQETSVQPEIVTLKENIFIPEVKIVEVPVIVREIEYREIEKPIIIEKIVMVEKPIIIKEIEIKEITKERHYPFVMKASAVIQAISVIVLILINLFKK